MRKICVFALLCFFAVLAKTQTYTPAPMPRLQFSDTSGIPLAGGFVCTYLAGTTTPQATYTNSSGTTQNPVCVPLDSAGRASIFLGNAGYKFVLQDFNHVAQWTADGIYGTVGFFSSPPPVGNITPNTINATTITAASGAFSGNVSALAVVPTTPIAVANGGTGSASAAAARTGLGVTYSNLPDPPVIVAGQGANTTIQATISAAGSTGNVQIPASYSGSDTYINPTGVKLVDQRPMTDELAKLSSFMEPWLARNGSSSGGNMTTLATCIAAGECTVSGIGNSLMGSGGTQYENGVFSILQESLRARFPTVKWHFKNRYLGGRLTANAIGSYLQLPICPTNTPACATVTAPTTGNPFYSYSYSTSYGYYFPAVGNTIASTGPFIGSDDYPWEKWTAVNYQGWLNACTLDAPDLFVVLFAMNDEGNSSGATFTANIKSIIAPLIALPKVPSVLLVAGANGSVSTAGTAYFSAFKYLALDEFADDLRGLAKQYNYGLIDAARVLSALRDGSDPVSSFFESDNAGFNNLATNWNITPYGVSSASMSTDGFTATVTSNNFWHGLRKTVARDVILSAQWDTSNTNVIPYMQWRVPTNLSTAGYQLYLMNSGGGVGTLTLYSATSALSSATIASAAVSGLTGTTSMMVKSVGAEIRVWVNGVMVIGPSVGSFPAAGFYDYDSIQPGWYGVGLNAKSIGTSSTAAITAVSFVSGSPLSSCATPIPNRQAAPPCASALVSDEALYGFADTGPRALGGNQVNHPSIAGASATYGVAMTPFLDHLGAIVAQQTAIQTSQAAISALATSTDGSWTPTATGLTVVGSAPILSGLYTVTNGRIVNFIVTVTCSSGCTSTASTVGTTYFSLPFANAEDTTASIYDDTSNTSLGVGLVHVSHLYPQSWTASNHLMLITGWYRK